MLDIFRRKIIKDKGKKEKIKTLIESKIDRVDLLINNNYEGIANFINDLKAKNKYSENYIRMIIYCVLNYQNWFHEKE